MSGRCQAGCQTDVRQMPGRCLADARQMPGRCQADVRQMPGICQADARQMPDARQMSGRCQADYAIMPGRYQADVRPLNWPRRESRSVCNYNYIHIRFRVDSLFPIPRQRKLWERLCYPAEATVESYSTKHHCRFRIHQSSATAE